MFDHLSLGVRDLGAARRFYDAFFAPLGASIASEKPGEIAYGPHGTSGLFYLYPSRVSGSRAWARTWRSRPRRGLRSMRPMPRPWPKARPRSASPAGILISPPTTTDA